MRGEETAGRLEMRLSGTLSRMGWLGAHGIVIVMGVFLIVVASSLVLAAGMAWSMGTANLPRVLGAGLAYLPAELLIGALALALFGLRPRALPAAWAAVAVVGFIALLGSGLQLPQWLIDVSPISHIGDPPLGSVDGVALGVVGAIAAILGGAAAVGFRWRGVPQG